MSAAGYESFFGLVERPFSLTPDPKYCFKSRAHGRALESLTFGLRRRDRFLLLTGDLGFGKTTICRTLVEQLRRRVPVAYAANPLLSPEHLLRLILEDFGAVPDRTLHATNTSDELYKTLADFLTALERVKEGAVLIVDEAHTTPPLVMEELTRLSTLSVNGEKAMQIVFAAQPPDGETNPAWMHRIDRDISTRARLLPFGREDCAEYVAHRLKIAGGARIAFTSRAIDVLFNFSGGVPRLVNLLCERALQEAAAAKSHKIEPAFVEAAASALELLRARPKRFRWFNKRVS